MSDTDPAEEATPAAQAGRWLAALQRPDREPKLEAELRAWLSADPTNRVAFDRATRIWDLLGSAGLAIRVEQRRRKTIKRVAITAAAACLMVAVGVGAGAVSQNRKRRRLSAA